MGKRGWRSGVRRAGFMGFVGLLAVSGAHAGDGLQPAKKLRGADVPLTVALDWEDGMRGSVSYVEAGAEEVVDCALEVRRDGAGHAVAVDCGATAAPASGMPDLAALGRSLAGASRVLAFDDRGRLVDIRGLADASRALSSGIEAFEAMMGMFMDAGTDAPPMMRGVIGMLRDAVSEDGLKLAVRNRWQSHVGDLIGLQLHAGQPATFTAPTSLPMGLPTAELSWTAEVVARRRCAEGRGAPWCLEVRRVGTLDGPTLVGLITAMLTELFGDDPGAREDVEGKLAELTAGAAGISVSVEVSVLLEQGSGRPWRAESVTRVSGVDALDVPEEARELTRWTWQ